MKVEKLTTINDQLLMNDEQWNGSMINEQWTMKNEQESMINEQWTMNDAQA